MFNVVELRWNDGHLEIGRVIGKYDSAWAAAHFCSGYNYGGGEKSACVFTDDVLHQLREKQKQEELANARA